MTADQAAAVQAARGEGAPPGAAHVWVAAVAAVTVAATGGHDEPDAVTVAATGGHDEPDAAPSALAALAEALRAAGDNAARHVAVMGRDWHDGRANAAWVLGNLDEGGAVRSALGLGGLPLSAPVLPRRWAYRTCPGWWWRLPFRGEEHAARDVARAATNQRDSALLEVRSPAGVVTAWRVERAWGEGPSVEPVPDGLGWGP